MRLALLPLLLLVASCDNPCSAKTFTQIKSCVFVPSCGGMTICHTPDQLGGPAGHLDLVTDPYAALINVPPDAASAAERSWAPPASMKRVAPGDENNSFLWIKLNLDRPGQMWTNHPELGYPMPEDSDPLDPRVLDDLLRWIKDGAPNN
jgi:hypothetical protein